MLARPSPPIIGQRRGRPSQPRAGSKNSSPTLLENGSWRCTTPTEERRFYALGFRHATSSVQKQVELERSQRETSSALRRLAQSWSVDPDANADRARRTAAAAEVLDWILADDDLVHSRFRALESALCFRGGDVIPIADFAEVNASRQLQSLEKRFPETLRSFLREWASVKASYRWKQASGDRRLGPRLLSSACFDSLARYLADYLTSEGVFDRLCSLLLEIIRLSVANKADRRQARRRFVLLVLNDYVMGPGERLMPIGAEVDSPRPAGAVDLAFGLITPLVRRWQRRLPVVLASGAGNPVNIPQGNNELIDISNRFTAKHP